MINQQISDIFMQMADILEIIGADVFRVNSHRKVARVIGECNEDIGQLARDDRLTELAGVGKSSAQKIREFVETGRMQAFEELLNEIPRGLPDLLKIPGLGPKGVRAVWQGLGVTNVAELQAVIEDKRLEELPGFGARKAAALAKGIAFLQAGGDRVRLDEAMGAAETMVAALEKLKAVERIEIAGSLRRGRETIGDIDLLVVSDKPQEVIEAFTRLDGVKDVLGAGDTKASVRYENAEVVSSSLQADLRVVEAESFAAAWMYFTGSKDHNVHLREIAVKQKLKLNEYGLFKGEKPQAAKTEADIYKKLGLAYVPPALREDRGEIEAAEKNTLPELVTVEDIRGDLHTHTPASDGRSTLEEMVAAARTRGYRYLAVTDHSVSETIANGLDAKRLLKHVEAIRKFNETLKDFTVLAGSEVDIKLDGSLDYEDEVLAELDFVMASVHSGMRGDREKLTARVMKAMDNPYVNCIGHPTGRMINQREAMDLDMKAIIEHAAATGTALEVSSSPYRLDLKDTHCRLAVEAGAKLIINTDAHDTAGLNKIHYGVITAQRGWVTKENVLNTQSITTLRKFIKYKRP